MKWVRSGFRCGLVFTVFMLHLGLINIDETRAGLSVMD